MVEKKEYLFKKKKRTQLTNGFELIVFSLTDAELSRSLQKKIEEAVVELIKDEPGVAYTVVKE
jgi:hypothetical protein